MILHFIQDLFHVLVVLCLLHSLAAAPCTQYDYSTASSVTVSNYNQLNCAVFYEVPLIYVNQTISFSSEIVLPSQSNITVQGSTSNIALRTSGSARLFNVTRAQLSLGNLLLLGDVSGSALNGGLLFSQSSTLLLSSVSMTLGTASCGSSLYALNSTIRISDTTVSNSSASGQSCGGSVFVSDSSLSVLSSSFTSNKGAAGGAIFSTASNINISGSRFTSNAASVTDGGALRVSGGILTITTTSFLRNTAAGSGGSIELVNSVSATIVETNFTSDSAASLGGSIFSSAARISLTSVSIKSATANNGGGLAVSQGGSVVISSSQFAQNQGGNAGAIFCVGSAASFSSVKLYSTNFLGNVAINSGGAIQVTSYCSVTIQKSQLTSNVVLDSDTPISLGGAVSCQYGNVTLIASDLTSSQAVQGSAIYSFFCNLQILSSSIRNSVAGDGSVYCTFQTALLVQNSTFFNNTGTTSSSGIICLNSDSCDISSSTFLHNTAAQLGVVQMADADSVSILDSDFGFNSAEGIGGAVYLNNIRQGQILNSHFYNNSATTYGGSIAVLNSDVSINSTTIRNSFANSGGALYLFQLSEVSLFNCSFQSSQALDSGGAIYVGDQSILRGDLVTLSSCEGPYGGALYMSYKSSAAFRYLKAQNNIAGFSGGVFGLFAYASLTVSDSFITSNQAFLGGAFSLQYYCSATVTNTRFSTNTANSYGGVAYVLISSSLAVSNCNLTSNSGTFGGGAFFVESSSVNVTASTIDGHEGNVGGGIYAISGEIEASDTVFSNNGGSTYEGGTVYLSASSSFRSQRCNFTANQAEYGGVAAIVQSSFFSFQDSITQCSGLTGPCLYALQNSTVVLTQSDISDNEQELTSTDGLFHIDTGILRADGITVKNNVVQSHGVFGLFSVAATFTNTTFSKNRAKILTSSSSSSASGAIYIACTSPCVTSAASKKLSTLISGSTFLDNIAESGDGGAVYISSYPGKVSIDSSTFQNNEGKNGGAVSVSLSLVSVTRSSFVGNVATEGGGAIFWIYSNIYPTTVDESSSALSSNNFASYGQFTATDLVFLSSYFPTQYKPVSGKPLNSTIEVYLKDYYGQVVTNTSLYSDATLTIYCSVYKDSGVVKGSSTVPSKHGVAGFTQIVVTGVPGENTTLVFSVPISNINDTYQTIHFRECESGEITTSVGDNLYTCQECGLGTYSFYPSDTSCNICPDHAYCPGANVISVDSGYWRVNQVSASVLECPQRDPCLGGSNTSTQCAEGSYGPYCSLCETGYTASRSGICYSCEDSSDTARELVSTVLFIFVGLMAMVAFKYRKRLVAFYSRTMKAIVKNRKFRTLRVKVKIVVAFCQIVYQLGPALNIVFPASFFEYLNYYAIFQLNLLLIPNVSCMVNTNYYDGLLVSTISPFLFFAVIVVVIQFLVIRARRLNERNPSYKVDQAKRDVITAAFLISYFVMVNVSTQIFRVFQCEEFDDGNSYLVADYSIDCNAPNRSFYVAYGVVMIFIYPIGIPLAYAIVLFSYRKKINPDWRKVIDSNEKVFVSNRVIQQEKIKVRNTYPEIDNIRNLFDSYTPKRWYFELFDCARRLCLGAVPVLIFRGSSLQIIIVLLISLFSVASFMYFNPYIHEHDNHLAILSQWSITLIVIAALIIKVQALTTDPNDNQGLGVVLILLNLIIITFAIATAFMNSKETSDDDPKGLFGEDIEVDEDDEDDEEEGKKEEKKDKKKRSNGSIIGLFTNPMRSAARKKDDSQPGRSVDSDVGSDGEADEDDRSLDSDDDNYQSRVSSSRRSTAQVDEERSNHRGHESNEARDEGNSRSRSVLSKVFSSRTKSRSVASGGTSTASTGGVELHVMKTQHNPMIGGDEREENESIERETKGFEEFSDQHPVNTEPLPHPLASAPAAPPRSFLRSNDAAIDSDDDEA